MSLVPDHYWKNLLKEATQYSTNDLVPDTDSKLMSEKDRKWLENVMEKLVDETDIGRRLERTLHGLKLLAAKGEKNEEDLKSLTELAFQLEDLVQFADLTPFFIREKGLELIENFMSRDYPLQIQLIFAQLISTLAENNPPAQEAIVSNHFLERLLKMVNSEETPEVLRLKLLGSISGIVRSNISAYSSFSLLSGPSMFSQLVHDETVSLSVASKAARILTSIAYTLIDDNTSKSLSNYIAGNYVTLVRRDVTGEASSELDYIREYLLQFVEWNDLDDNTKEKLVQTFQVEANDPNNQDEFSSLQKLIQKFSPHKCG